MPQASGPTPGEQTANAIRWLQVNRLLNAAGLLADRSLVSDQVATLAGPLATKRELVSEARLSEENRVFAALANSNVSALALKGCRLAHTIYPDPAQRLRADIDILVAPTDLDKARDALRELGYRPEYDNPGGTPIPQEAWVRETNGYRFMVDLHWKLRTHPCLRDRLDFDEQWQARVPLPALAEGAFGQSAPHALLNASMHWFDNLYGHRYPLHWILDKDLLWRAMEPDEREEAVALACERGLGGLLAESLRLARDHFLTPVDDDTIGTLDAAGKGRRPTRLIALQHRRVRSWLFALRCEPGWRGKWHRLKESILPPAAHMRERYPAGSRWGLPGLYWRRIRSRLGTHPNNRTDAGADNDRPSNHATSQSTRGN